MYKFEKLEVWKLSLEYHDLAYDFCKELPDFERFNLIDQMRRAATSICLNIVEGSTGQTNKEQRQFLKISIRSCYETIGIRKISERKDYLNSFQKLAEMDTKVQILLKKLQAFRNSL